MSESTVLSDRHHAHFRRVMNAVDNRCEILDYSPDPEHVFEQIALRALHLQGDSLRAEIGAVRRVLACRLQDGSWPGAAGQPWLTDISAATLTDLHDRLCQAKAKDLKGAGRRILDGDMEMLLQSGRLPVDEQTPRRLAGMNASRRNGKSEGDPPVSESDMASLDSHVSDSSLSAGIASLGDPFSSVRVRPDFKALLRIFMHVVWLTGMTPAEVLRFRILVPQTDGDENDIAQVLRENPRRAITEGLLDDIPDPSDGSSEAWTRSIRLVQDRLDEFATPAVAIVPDRQDPAAFRVLVLDCLSWDQLEILAMAARLHRMDINPDRQKALVPGMSSRLKTIGRRALGRTLSFRDLRDSFAHRAARRLGVPAAAALLGHRMKRSTSGYRNLPSANGEDMGGWLPHPDPAVADSLAKAWNMPNGPKDAASMAAAGRGARQKTCSTCRWFNDGAPGTCRRLPPAPVYGALGIWPVVNRSGWCGEWDELSVAEDCPRRVHRFPATLQSA